MPAPRRPNFLIFLADDMGFSDIGCYGSEIRTPNIDKLAQKGVRFTDFHATAACSPSRSMLLTGTDNHIAGLGTLVELMEMPAPPVPGGLAPARGKPGYEGYLNERVVTVAELLRDAGYLTLCSGKWHLGLRKETSPAGRGFERSFALLPGASNHFGWTPQLQDGPAEVPSPFKHDYPLHMQDGNYVWELPEGWYSSDSYGDILLNYIKEWHSERAASDASEGAAAADGDRPFFAYLPFTAPHWPLQAPQDTIRHYRGVYDDGPDVLRTKRLQRLKDLGLVDATAEAHPVVQTKGLQWAEMNTEQRAKSSRAMEVYAAMVERIDANVGKIMDFLEETGELDNTFILFMSDNGAEGGAFEAEPAFRGRPMAYLQKYFNNSVENLGNFDSYIWYGPEWAQASTAPSRLFKGFTTEGGIRVPLVAKFPTSYGGAAAPNSICDLFATIMDITPTCLDMAGVTHPAPTYQDRPVVGMRGGSWTPWLSGRSDSIHEKEFVEGWELNGRAAVRRGAWKAVYLPAHGAPPSALGRDEWELFDLSKDPGETNNLSEQHPDILRDLVKEWDKYVIETGVIPLNPELGEFVAASEEQMPPNGWLEFEYWQEGSKEDPAKFTTEPKRFDFYGQRTN